MIQPIIHQIWHPFAAPSLPAEWERYARSWRRWHPGYQYRLWGPEESRRFVAERFPAFLATYDGYVSPMKRVAALRYLLLQHHGGIVVDLDVECLRNVDPLLTQRRVVLAVEPLAQWPEPRVERNAPVLSTAFMASEAGDPLWATVLEELSKSAGSAGVPESVGHLFLTRCYDSYSDKLAVTLAAPEAICPVSVQSCRDGSAFDVETWIEKTRESYAIHHWAGTWNRPGLDPLPAARTYVHGVPARVHYPAWRRHRPGHLFDTGPHVSCIMVTRGWAEPARWAIEAFRAQSYVNRELVIVTTNTEGDVLRYIEALQDPTIRCLDTLPAGTSLGAQRNAGVEAARGDLICTWDDDDLYGADRLAASITALATTGAAAAFLDRIGVWWPSRQQYSITPRRPWENTMVARRQALPRYPEVDRGEDTRVIDGIIENHPIVTLDDPNLYTYVVWGTNTWGVDHFQRMLRGATFHAEGVEYDRVLSVLQKHAPVLDYLTWLQRRDPKTYDPPTDSPAQVPAVPLQASERQASESQGSARQIRRSASAVRRGGPERPLRVLLASERSSGLGPLVRLAQVAGPLLDAGHEVHWAASDLTSSGAALGRLIGHPRLHQWQSPVWGISLQGPGEAACYAELLFRIGYLDHRKLLGLVRGWESLLRHIQPQLLLAEHAPTALLAARGRDFPRALIGSGYCIPVKEAPMPSFPEWEAVPVERVAAAEERALSTCNAVLAVRGVSPLSALWELTEAEEEFLTTIPELDPYQARSRNPDQTYSGLLEPPTQGTPAPWPRGTEPAVFAYLRGEHGVLEAALKTLRDGPWRVLAVCPGIAKAMAVELSTRNLIVVSDPVNMREVCDTCDAVVCNAGAGTTTTALYAGKPVVLLPQRLEQLMLAQQVQNLGAGLVLLESQLHKLKDALGRVLLQPSFTEAARALARRYGFTPGTGAAESIAARCVELIERSAATAGAPPRRIAAT